MYKRQQLNFTQFEETLHRRTLGKINKDFLAQGTTEACFNGYRFYRVDYDNLGQHTWTEVKEKTVLILKTLLYFHILQNMEMKQR